MMLRAASLIASFALASACGRQGGVDGKLDPDADLPHLLYDRGDNVPTVLAERGDTLYWAESSPEHGPRILRAPKDGAGEPEVLGTRSSYDIARFSVSDRHVFWQDNGLLIAFDLATNERKELGRLVDGGYGGPSLAVDDDWAAFADASCRSVTTVRLSTGELHHARIHEELRGGQTSLALVEGTVLCANGPEIVRVTPGSSTFEHVWRTKEEPLWVYGGSFLEGFGVIIQLARSSGAVSMSWTSLQRLELPSYQQTELLAFPGTGRIDFTVDRSSETVFFGRTFERQSLEVLHLRTGERSTLPGEVFLGILLGDETHLYWSEPRRDGARNAIYRQRKPVQR